MSCFWNAIIGGLDWTSIKNDHKPTSFIEFLKSNNKKTDHVLVNDCPLSDVEKKENHEAIQELRLENGYLCSTSDPVLCLVAELFAIQIHHSMNGCKTVYRFKDANRSLHLTSSASHCSLSKKL